MRFEVVTTQYGPLPASFRCSKLAEVCVPDEGIQTGPFGSQLHQRDYVNDGTPIITVEHLGENRIIHRDLPKVSDDDRERLSRYKLQVGDIVFSRVGSVDRRALVREEEDGWLFSGRCLRVRPNTKLIDAHYLSWFFGLSGFKEYIRGIAVGATMPSLNTDILSNIPIYYPPLGKQQEIAAILDAIDHKIEFNQQINITLESIGQAIFKRWFIDFEFPNEKGKPYKSSGGEMVHSEQGELPEGWTEGRLGDICDITMGQSPPGSTYNESGEGMCFYQGITDFGFRFPTKRVFCTAPTRFAEEGDVLLSVRAPVGTLNVAEERCALGRGVASVRLKGKHNGFLYYLLLATKSGWETFEAEGTVFGAANKTDVHDFTIVIPPKPLIEKFASIVEPMDVAIRNSEKESRTLTGLRDFLLPRLMSGKIRVTFGGAS